MSGLKKALILAYDFPPFNSIGAQRPAAWFQYFRSFGLHPVVVTRHWDRPINGPADCNLPSFDRSVSTEEAEHGTVIRVPYTPSARDKLMFRTDPVAILLRKFLSVWQLLTEHHLRSSDNKANICDAAREFLKSNKVDVIIACGEPFVLFRYAAELSLEFNVPWIGDYRDGWSTNYRWDEGGAYAWIQQTVQRRVEKRIIPTAALLTTAAPDFSIRIAKLIGKDPNTLPVVYNGYFEEKFGPKKQKPLRPTFTIVHAGTLYYFQRVETFLKGLNLFLRAHPGKRIDTIFYGLDFYPNQINRIRSAADTAHVEFINRMPHDDMLEELFRSHVQLLLATPEKHQVYAKVFDYIGTGRPILMVENDHGPLENILSHRQNATACSSPMEVKAYLESIYDSAENMRTIPNNDHTFTRRSQTRRFADLVLEAIEASG